MPAEGQTARGPNGERAVYRNGEWVVVSQAAPQMPTDPAYPFKGEAAALDVAGKRANISNDAERLRLAQEAAEVDRQRAAIAAREAEARRTTTDARGGVDSTESERTAAFLATRVAGGIQDLGRIGNIGAPSLKDALVGGTLLGNYTTDADRQRAIAAQRDILDAALTLGTGAAYTQEQIDAYRGSYFAQPGDAPETVKDKSLRLQRLLEASRLKAGASASMIDDALSFTPGGLQVQVTDDSPEGGVELDRNGNPVAINITGGAKRTPPPRKPKGYQDSYMGQGMSGLNEGIAGLVGAPVDLATMAMNAVPAGINAVANTNIPRIQKPFMGSEWISDKFRDGGAVYGASNDPRKQFVRRAGQSVGSAIVPLGAAPRTAAGMAKGFGIAAGGGVGAAGAQQMFPGNPAAEFAGELMGSGLTAGGLIANGRRQAVREAIQQVPSRDELRDQASNLYNQAESRGIVAGPNVTSNLAGRVRQIARDEELITPTGRVVDEYPRAAGSMRLLDDYQNQTINPRQIQVIRRNLSDAVQATDGNERRIARQMLNAFDEETIPLAPELAQARGVASRYLQSDEIARARQLAEPRAAQFSGSGMENALRTEFRRLDRNLVDDPASLNPAAANAVRRVSRGTPKINALRQVGKAAPTGVVSTGFSAGVPFMIGNSLGGPTVGAAASAATMGIGTLARRAATNAMEREVQMADTLARNGGELNTGPLVDEETMDTIRRLLLGQGSQYVPR